MTDSPNGSDPEVLKSAHELAKILKKDSDGLDTAAWSRGDSFLLIANDPQFGKKTAGLADQKIKIIQQAIEDLSARGKVLSEAFFGLTFFENQIQTFICQYGEAPMGKVIFKIAIKNVAAFVEWRKGGAENVSEEDLNSAIYRLAALWAEFL